MLRLRRNNVSMRRTALLVLILFGLAPCLHAQSTEADLLAQLVGKLVYLRGCWDRDTLHFDSKGKLRDKSGQVSIMICGYVPQSAQLKGKKLILKGFRAGLAVQNDDLVQVSSDMPTQVEIDAPRDGDYGAALAKVFAPTLADMVSMLPDYWQKYAREHFSQPVPLTVGMNLDTVPPDKDSRKSGVTPPQLIKHVEAEFSQEARNNKINGTVAISMWVGFDGIPYHLTIAKPAGYGLDKKALECVQQWRFKPAMKNGKPIPFALNVEVHFQIFDHFPY